METQVSLLEAIFLSLSRGNELSAAATRRGAGQQKRSVVDLNAQVWSLPVMKIFTSVK